MKVKKFEDLDIWIRSKTLIMLHLVNKYVKLLV